MGRTSFGKHAREQAKREKAAAKREDRRQRAENQPADDAAPAPTANVSTEDLLARIAALHEQFDAGTISYDDFEATKAELLAQLPVD